MRRDRVTDWPERLVEAIELQRRAPFCWGAADCATLFGAVIEAMTGEDPLARYRPWSSETTAARALLSSGSRTVTEFVRTILVEIPPSMAGRGDFGYLGGARNPLQFPAVITGAEAMSRDPAGWIVVPRGMIVEAYSLRARA
tara:strand:- start:12585 stop:13010 length:426 start_codon:yes stop_codon:yes gene_type:complete